MSLPGIQPTFMTINVITSLVRSLRIIFSGIALPKLVLNSTSVPVI
jgi:hypothetical protein